MSEIDWSKAPEWADRVIEGGASNLMYWASDNTLQPVKGCASFVTDTHIRNGLPVVERRPVPKTIDIRAAFATAKPLVMLNHPCNAEPVPITIEQRIASLRALEKQVEETRAELTRDLEALGLTWMVRDDPEQPTITDWRDLWVGDVIGFDGVDGEWDILNLEDEYDEAPIKVSDDINAECTVEGWVNILSHPWRFIRRP